MIRLSDTSLKLSSYTDADYSAGEVTATSSISANTVTALDTLVFKQKGHSSGSNLDAEIHNIKLCSTSATFSDCDSATTLEDK